MLKETLKKMEKQEAQDKSWGIGSYASGFRFLPTFAFASKILDNHGNTSYICTKQVANSCF